MAEPNSITNHSNNLPQQIPPTSSATTCVDNDSVDIESTHSGLGPMMGKTVGVGQGRFRELACAAIKFTKMILGMMILCEFNNIIWSSGTMGKLMLSAFYLSRISDWYIEDDDKNQNVQLTS